MPSKSGQGAREWLTPKQAHFVEAMLLDPDHPTAAAVSAGVPVKSAAVMANKWLKMVKITSALEASRRAREARTQITQDRVLQELAILGFSDVSQYTLDERYHLTPVEGTPASAMRAVASVKHKVREHYREGDLVGVDHDVEYRLWDKNVALTSLAKHLGLLIERHEINITQQQLIAVRTMSDLELSAFLAALDGGQPEAALRLLPGGTPA
jgi:phage terminase small subunit